jgi:uncharacterized membrane protein SpoIIM required for sporulation
MAEPLPAFVARRRPEWTQLETMIARLKAKALTLADLTTLDALYRRVSADLAVAQASYPNTDVQRFLNQLCATAYAAIYRPRGAPLESLRTFYLHTFPRLVRELLGPIQFAAGLLLFGGLLGALTVVLAPDGAHFLVPANLRGFIDRGELWTDSALGAARTPSQMAVEIFLNNLRVMISAFALGVTAGLGTVVVIFANGLSLGAIMAACFQGGVGWNIVNFISAHGPIELSVICIAGGAGLHLGRALLSPGERSRAVAMRAHAQVAVQVLLGAAPFMVLIGVVEGFVSPGPFFPWALKIAVGALSGFGFWRWLLRS